MNLPVQQRRTNTSKFAVQNNIFKQLNFNQGMSSNYAIFFQLNFLQIDLYLFGIIYLNLIT